MLTKPIICAIDLESEGKVQEKLRLETEVDTCTEKLLRAEKLIDGLGGERVRWSQAAKALEAKQVSILGDMLVAAATISYLGAFPMPFRQEAICSWVRQCKAIDIPGSEVSRLLLLVQNLHLLDSLTTEVWLSLRRSTDQESWFKSKLCIVTSFL